MIPMTSVKTEILTVKNKTFLYASKIKQEIQQNLVVKAKCMRQK